LPVDPQRTALPASPAVSILSTVAESEVGLSRSVGQDIIQGLVFLDVSCNAGNVSDDHALP